MTKVYRPNRNMIEGFERLQEKYMGGVRSNEGYRGYCELNGQCDEFYTSIRMRRELFRENVETPETCGLEDIAYIDGNGDDVSFGDLFVHNVRTNPTYQRFAGFIWYEPDPKPEKRVVDPIALDDDLVKVLYRNFDKCSEDGMDPIEALVSKISKDELSESEAATIMAEVAQIEKDKVAEELDYIMGETHYERGRLSDIRYLGRSGPFAVPAFKTILASMQVDESCEGEGSSARGDRSERNVKTYEAIAGGLITIIDRGGERGARAIADLMPELVTALESGSLSFVEPVVRSLPYVKDKDLKARAESMIRYVDERSNSLSRAVRGLIDSYFSKTGFSRKEACLSRLEKRKAIKLMQEREQEAEAAKWAERAEAHKAWDTGWAVGVRPAAGGFYMSDLEAFGREGEDFFGIYYALEGHLGMGWVRGDDLAFTLALQTGLGGMSCLENEDGDSMTVGTFTVGLRHSGLNEIGDGFGYSVYAGYVMPFRDSVLESGIQAEALFQMDFDIGIGVGPFGQYYPETETYSVGLLFSIGHPELVMD